MPKLAKQLKDKPQPAKEQQEPLWKGPEVDGVTQSLLSRFLQCRERFRVYAIEGLRPVEQFNHRIEYGSMWHVCEESLAATPNLVGEWVISLGHYAKGLCKKYPLQQEQIQHWYNVCRVQFPVYADYWAKHPDVKYRTPLLQEQVFDVPCHLPSGRIVRLRGKWDSVDLIGKGKSARVYLQENKTKGDVNEQQLQRQLASGFDLQTMFYLVALSWFNEHGRDGRELPEPETRSGSIAGVRYNVVRRPLSGGKGSISQHKPSKSNPAGETPEEFYSRLAGIIAEDPGYFFMRWRVEITPADLQRFQWECLNPILEQLCDWWYWLSQNPENPWWGFQGRHFRYPYGVYNILTEGGTGELDEYLNSGSALGLERTTELFRELSDA